MRTILFHLVDGWAQLSGIAVEDGSTSTADALAAAYLAGQWRGPGDAAVQGAVVVERAARGGHLWERRVWWSVVGDPRFAASWSAT